MYSKLLLPRMLIPIWIEFNTQARRRYWFQEFEKSHILLHRKYSAVNKIFINGLKYEQIYFEYGNSDERSHSQNKQ